MRVHQLVLSSASQYEQKNARVDREAFEIVDLAQAQIAHVYATGELHAKDFVDFPIPYIATAPMKRSRFTWRKPKEPALVITSDDVPEAVEERYWNASERRQNGNVIGSFARNATRNMVEQTLTRIHRFRDDVTWKTFAQIPSPQDLASVDIWTDPAIDDTDLDGFVAEALVVGLPVVAARTKMNNSRLEKGRTGWLVPMRDPNEMTHAILAALFKPEVVESKLAASRQTISKFRARQRTRVLGRMYENLIR